MGLSPPPVGAVSAELVLLLLGGFEGGVSFILHGKPVSAGKRVLSGVWIMPCRPDESFGCCSQDKSV